MFRHWFRYNVDVAFVRGFRPSGAAPLCRCGCGGPVRPRACSTRRSPQWNVFLKGHILKGANHYAYRGGVYTGKGGYIYLRRPDHPNANPNGYVKRSRLVAEEAIGRQLSPGEVVHHKNGIKDDDRPEHLQVLDRMAHHRLHAPEYSERLRGDGAPHARMTPEIIRAIREGYDTIGIRELSTRLGFAKSTIWLVAKRKRWAHVA
jgi:hypothetical protein